jgi:hypothetical protein
LSRLKVATIPIKGEGKRMMLTKIKRLLIAVLMAAISLGHGASPAFAADQQPVNLYLFWTKGCPHCALEKEFLTQLTSSHPESRDFMLVF